MITYTWFHGQVPDEVDELRSMLAQAAVEDDGAGFPQLSLAESEIPDAAHLLVWLVPDERPEGGRPPEPVPILAAYLRVERAGEDTEGTGVVRFVVRPELRSRGIATMLFEQLGLDVRASGGWAGTGARGLRIWARGNHPAAQRMAWRFHTSGVRRARREWQLLAPLRPGREIGAAPRVEVRAFDPAHDAPALIELRAATGSPPARGAESRCDDYLFVAPSDGRLNGAISVDPDAALRTDYGQAGLITEVLVSPVHASGPTRSGLLAAGLECLRDKGLRVGAITVNAEDEPLVRDCRLLGFQHDRTDCLYQLP